MFQIGPYAAGGAARRSNGVYWSLMPSGGAVNYRDGTPDFSFPRWRCPCASNPAFRPRQGCPLPMLHPGRLEARAFSPRRPVRLSYTSQFSHMRPLRLPSSSTQQAPFASSPPSMPSPLADRDRPSSGVEPVTLHICVTCRRGGEPLEPREERSGAKLALALGREVEARPDARVRLRPVECLSGCKRGCTVAISEPGKWTFVIADIDPARHASDLIAFAEQYAAHPEGLPQWRERPEIVKRSVLARVPPLTPSQPEEERLAP